MSGIIAGAKSIGMFTSAPPPATLPAFAEDPNEILQMLISRVDGLQTLVEGKADANRIKTLIRYSDETILIQAQEIALRGNVTILDVENDRTGQNPGTLSPSFTRIRGGVIQTEQIISSNWSAGAGSSIDLDNGTITMGGSSSPKLKFNSGTGNLTISGTLQAGSIITNSVTIDGVTIGTIKTKAEAGDLLNTALTVSGTTILKGVLVPTDSGALKTGTITWNSTTGVLTGGTGVAITEFGIIGAASGSPTFSIDASTGAAVFAGTLSAASGSFVGTISTSSYVIATGSTAAPSGMTACVIGNSAGSHAGVIGYAVVDFASGVVGDGSGGSNSTGGFFRSGTGPFGVGVSALAMSGSAIALDAYDGGHSGALAFRVRGQMTIDNTTLVTNLNADTVDGKHANSFMEINVATFLNLATNTTWRKIQTSTDGSTVASSIYVRVVDW